MEINQAFGTVLRKLRKNSGMSQEALALECNLDRTYISLLERGLRQPSIKTLFKLVVILKISPANFVTDVEKQLHD